MISIPSMYLCKWVWHMGVCSQFRSYSCVKWHGVEGVSVRDVTIKLSNLSNELREAFNIGFSMDHTCVQSNNSD